MRALFLALVAISVLLTGCDQGESAGGCSVDADTADLRAQKAEVGMADCPVGDGDADLPDVALTCLGGGTAGSLSDIEGPAIVNFWGSNCTPCVKEMPALQAFSEQYGDQVPVIGVDFLDTYPGAALDLAKRTGATYPSYADPCGDLQDDGLNVVGLPTFAFVKADGSVELASPGGLESVDEIVDLTEDKLGIELERSAS
ncbi:TlpA family protein disulfide reductase [Nocardioides humilatus]|uniref:TlpA family protein disulfide reductase n=1 Tax=Nocardioides humilatus TaxID=2607660 RepID=A0A5B1LG15_9ACTN|nr:TlpA disulfide reductase family protein [Nocardioides humilatus]KAA1419593.1 TlpA family protein disulfide reductase [Nocardioides humilatus]